MGRLATAPKLHISLLATLVASSLRLPVSAGLVPSPLPLPPREVQATVGENVTLRCPVSFKTDFVTWTMAGQPPRFLDLSTRHRPSDRGGALRILGLVAKDSGTYVCEAAGGHNHETSHVNLTVVDISDNSRELTNNEYPEYSDTGKPRFRQGLRRSSWYTRVVGSEVSFSCAAKGRPQLDVQWTKNGTRINLGLGEKKRIRWILTLSSLKQSDSGVYTCTVSNAMGAITANFTLEVRDITADEPELLGKDPANITVMFGNTATMLCRSKSKSPQKFQWLRRVEERDTSGAEDRPLQIDNELYRVLKDHQEVAVGPPEEGVYLSKLQISPITEDSKYICFAHNLHGLFTYRAAYVTVLSNPQELQPTPAHNFALTSVLVAVFVLILFLLLRFSLNLYRRFCSRAAKKSPASPGPAVPSPVPQDVTATRPKSSSTRHKHFHHHQHRHQHHLLVDNDADSAPRKHTMV